MKTKRSSNNIGKNIGTGVFSETEKRATFVLLSAIIMLFASFAFGMPGTMMASFFLGIVVKEKISDWQPWLKYTTLLLVSLMTAGVLITSSHPLGWFHILEDEVSAPLRFIGALASAYGSCIAGACLGIIFCARNRK